MCIRDRYNNEPISGEYISSTGSLTEGAQVIYALSEPTTTDISDLQDWDATVSYTHLDVYKRQSLLYGGVR